MSSQHDAATFEQFNELSLLQAMYEKDTELFYSGEISEDAPLPTCYKIRLGIDGSEMELFVNVPALYPIVEYPSIRVSGDSNVYDINQLNSYLRDWLHHQSLGEPLVSQIIEELRDVLDQFVSRRRPNDEGSISSGDSNKSDLEDKLARFWIYTHHLYSQNKRSDIIKLAKGYELAGFSTPGKPGVIVVEGNADSVAEFWAHVRNMDWYHIHLVEREIVPASTLNFLAFPCFKELVFDGGDHKKVDIGKVRETLEKFGLGSHFKTLYGF